MALSQDIQREIVKLYQEDCFSMAQIAKKLSVSQSAVVYYLQKNDVQRRSRSDAVVQWNITQGGKKAACIKSKLTQNEEKLRIAGVMLYWGEGSKGWTTVKFANSDPDMISVFLRFLREICGIWEDRLKAIMHLYPDHNENELRMFWSEVTGIPERNFYQSFIHEGKKGTYKSRAKYGTLTLNYSDKKLLEKINSWIDEYRNKS